MVCSYMSPLTYFLSAISNNFPSALIFAIKRGTHISGWVVVKVSLATVSATCLVGAFQPCLNNPEPPAPTVPARPINHFKNPLLSIPPVFMPTLPPSLKKSKSSALSKALTSFLWSWNISIWSSIPFKTALCWVGSKVWPLNVISSAPINLLPKPNGKLPWKIRSI